MMTFFVAYSQEPTHLQYVKPKASSEEFHNLYNSWTPGQPYSTQHADDEEFYISRVKPKARFNNSESQVFPTLDPGRKFLFWCPAGQNGTGDNQWNAIPTYLYDSEVFNMWSYVDHFGNWTANFIRMPGAFADVCHKNGVTTSVVAAIPWAANITGTDSQGGKGLKALIDGGADKMLKFLRYYGIDGIGLNSEFNFSTTTMANNFRNLLKDASSKRNSANWPTYGVAWYNLMTNAGKVAMGTDGSGGYLGTGTRDWFHSGGSEVTNYFFLNYPWYEGYPSTAATYLSNSQSMAESLGRSSYDVYAGINMQGASRVWLTEVAKNKISLGVWGAHNMNMIFENRNRQGAAPDIQQNTYMTTSEQFFTGGSQNPINSPALSEKFGANEAFGGISKLIAERSSLQGDLGVEPFVTYFNLGNGKFFNFQGVTTFPKEWYNIGMQDYLPTWRWWISNSFMGREASSVPAGLKAKFTWNDAWFGGSCMEVSGTNSGNAFIHLFKTKYSLQNGDKLKIRFKVVDGSADINWALSAEGSENSAVQESIATKSFVGSNKNAWIEREVIIGQGGLSLSGKTLAVMALNISNADNLKLLIGEVSLTRKVAVTPSAPSIIKSVSLAHSHKGADFKLIYSMNGGNNSENPTYNLDVNTWYFKIYSQQEGEEPVLCTTTTSWAAYVVGAPLNTEGAKRARYGVSAVSLDGKSESAITWTGYSTLPAVTIDETIVIDKPVIKAHELFSLKYVDPYHADADKWEIISQADGEIKVSQNNGKSLTASLATEGIYDARVTYNGDVRTMRGLIQISGPEVGALPEIYTLTANGSENSIEVEKLEDVIFNYTGRDADGYVSRGLRLPEKPFRIPIDQLGLVDKSTSFSLSFWFKADDFPAGVTTQMLNIRDVNGVWPANNWGFVWNNINPDGSLMFNVKNGSSGSGHGSEDNTIQITDASFKFESKVWTHITYVFSWVSSSLTIKVYVNGKLLATVPSSSSIYALNTSKTSLMIGGTAAGRGGLNGVIDEVQFYNKALTDSEVVRSMSHFEQNELPLELIAYFDFETEPDANNQLISTGTNTNLWAETSGQSPKPGGNEGETVFTPEASVFAPGAPFIPGSVFKIETLPVWNFAEGTVESAGGNSTEGTAVVKYNVDGNHVATLTLTNGWGSDVRKFEYVIVQTSTGVEDVLGVETSVYPNPFVEEVNVLFRDGGSYRIDVFNVVGQNVLTKNVNADGGDFVKIKVNAPKGTYIMKISDQQNVVKTLKLIKR
jgi:endo-beta-N-acetylglucosaminidase D